MNAVMRNIGAYIKNVFCGGSHATAAGTGDATAVTGVTIDRLGYESASVVVGYTATLTEAKTLTLAAEYQESADGSSWDTAVALQAATLAATGGSGGSTEKGEVEFEIDLIARKRYVRFNYTPDLTHTGTDVAVTACVATLGGAQVNPAV